MENTEETFLDAYLEEVQESQKNRISLNQNEKLVIDNKREKLLMIDKFLQKLIVMDLMVHHSDKYTGNSPVIPKDQRFSFTYNSSSKAWFPGISIFIDHPAIIEIAVPNNPKEEGAIVIKVASHHPDSYMLEQVFQSGDSALSALSRFLARNTVAIDTKKPKAPPIEDKQRKLIKSNRYMESHASSRSNSREVPEHTIDSIIKSKKISSIFSKSETDN